MAVVDSKRLTTKQSMFEAYAAWDEAFAKAASLESERQHLAQLVATNANVKLGRALSEPP